MAMGKNLEGDKFDGTVKNKEDIKKMQLKKTKRLEEQNLDHWSENIRALKEEKATMDPDNDVNLIDSKGKDKKGFRVPAKYIISHKKVWKKRWDFMVLFMAIYNSLQIPFQQAFNPEFFSWTIFGIFDSIVDFVFIFDIVLSFFTSIINKKGVESFDSKEIAKNYVQQFRFYADILSSLGASFFVKISKSLQIFGYVKMLRVFRLGGMIARANIDEVNKAVLNLSKLTFYLMFYLHLVGCYLWIVTGWHAGKEFYRIGNVGDGANCFYQHKDGDIMYTLAANGT